MFARPACASFLVLFVSHVDPVAADERDRFHAWISAGPTFFLGTPDVASPPDIPQPTFFLAPGARPVTALAFPVGEHPKGAIPQFQAGIALAATPQVAVSFDVRRLEVEQRPAEPGRDALRRSVLAWGPGVRRTVGHGTARPFLQANVLMITEDFHGAGTRSSENGVGLGLLAGADLHLTDALSVPVAVSLMLGQATNDVSSVGLVAGLAVHPSTGWSADPATRAIEVAAAQVAKPHVAAARRSRVELGAGSSAAMELDRYSYDRGRYVLGRVTYLRSRKPGLDLSLDARLYRRSRTDGVDPEYGGGKRKSTDTVVLVGPGVRFTRKMGWARRFFQANAWLSKDTHTTEYHNQIGEYGFETQQPGAGLGLALGFDVQLSQRLTLPMAVRYDQLIREDEDKRLTTLEGGLAYSWGTNER